MTQLRRFTLTLALLVLVVPPAVADTIYSYTGDTFREVRGIYTLRDRVSGWFAVRDDFIATPAPGGTDWAPGLTAYLFTDGHQILTETNSQPDAMKLSFSIFDGQPFAWQIILRGGEFGMASPPGLTAYLDGDRQDAARLSATDSGWTGSGTYWDGSHPGTWSVSVPEPASLVLALVGLGAVSVVRLRRR